MEDVGRSKLSGILGIHLRWSSGATYGVDWVHEANLGVEGVWNHTGRMHCLLHVNKNGGFEHDNEIWIAFSKNWDVIRLHIASMLPLLLRCRV